MRWWGMVSMMRWWGMVTRGWSSSTSLLGVASCSAPCLCSLMHLVESLEHVLRPDSLRPSNPDHVVARVLPLCFTLSTQVKVITHHALVPESFDRLVTSITSDPRMNRSTLLLILRSFLLTSWLDMESVEGPWHRSQRNHQLLISGNSNHVTIRISPGDNEVRSWAKTWEHGGELLLEVGEAGADILLHHKPPDFCVYLLWPLRQEGLVADAILHDCSCFVLVF